MAAAAHLPQEALGSAQRLGRVLPVAHLDARQRQRAAVLHAHLRARLAQVKRVQPAETHSTQRRATNCHTLPNTPRSAVGLVLHTSHPAQPATAC